MWKLIIKERFWIAPNALLYDKNISFKAKWLYVYLQSKPDWWNFSADRIKLETQDWRDAVRSWLQELEHNGYLNRRKNKNDKWQWEYNYELHSTPTFDTPSSENTMLVNTAYKKEVESKNDIVNNNTKNNTIYNTLVSEKTENKEHIKEDEKDNIDISNALLTQFNVVYEELNTKNSLNKCLCICKYIDKICALVNTQPIYNSRTINKFWYLIYWVWLSEEQIVEYVEENSQFVFENVLDMIDSVNWFSEF